MPESPEVEPWREVRVFISSTFLDMQAERDHLVRFVFPRLREVLIGRHLHLVDVDLRWGVTSDQNAFELCIDEIERCRPRFICILGGRYGWVPPGQYESITALEVREGALARLEDPMFRYFYFRDPSVSASIPEPFAEHYREAPGSDAERALDLLKQHARSSVGLTWVAPGDIRKLPLSVFEYSCAWDTGRHRLVGLREFGDRVYEDLLRSVEAELGPAAEHEPDEFEEQDALTEAFVSTHVQRYVVGNRKPVFDDLLAHARGFEPPSMVCVVGEPGTGKSALLAQLYREVAGDQPDALVIAHFVGVNATDTGDMARRMCHVLAVAIGVPPEPLPDDYPSLRQRFRGLLAMAARTRRVVLLIDGINRLDAGRASLRADWLPDPLPGDIRVILSSLEGEALDALRARRESPREAHLPRLAETDAADIVRGFFARYRKTLTSAQLDLLLKKDDARNPLYLLVAAEELRTLGAHDEMTHRIDALPGKLEALFGWILARLEEDNGFRGAKGEPVGRGLVRAWFTYLGLGRSGMTEQELAALVDPGDPEGNVAALVRLLRPYLMRRGELLDFFHGQLHEAVGRRYLASEEDRVAAHRKMAEYFASRTYSYSRTLSELAYHRNRGRQWPELIALMRDDLFLELTARRLGPSGSKTGWRVSEFLGESMDSVPPEALSGDRRIENLLENLPAFSAALELLHVRRGGRADSGAACKSCGQLGVIHGHMDLGGVDYYDNYFAWCPNCFWSWHAEDFSTSDAGLRQFDRETSTYR